MEDKQRICNKLVEALKLTRALSDIENLVYNEHDETVTAYFEEGEKLVNVACDSGVAMIYDIIRGLS